MHSKIEIKDINAKAFNMITNKSEDKAMTELRNYLTIEINQG